MNVYLSKYRKNKVKQMLCEGFGLDDIAAKTGLTIEQLKKATKPILPTPTKWWRKGMIMDGIFKPLKKTKS